MKILINYLKFRLLGIKPKGKKGIKPCGISHTIVSTEFTNNFKWDSHKYSNIKEI